MHLQLDPHAWGLSALPAIARGALCLALILGSGAGLARAQERRAEPIEVAVSVPPQAWLVERIGGDQVRVQVMIPAGVPPETWSPTPRQRAALERARVYVLVGHPDFIFERVHVRPHLEQHPEVAAVDMTAPHATGEMPADPAWAERAGDPHVWLSPAVVSETAVAIQRSLSALAPEHSAEFRANLASLHEDIEALDRHVVGSLSALPKAPASRSFLVVHPAWGWFARQYDLVQIAIEEEGKQPGPGELIPLIERARASRLRVVFVQPGFSRRRATLVAGEIGAELVELDPLARDWLDNMYRTAGALQVALLPESAGNG